MIQIMVILFFGVGLPLYAFFTGVYYLKKNQASQDRINRVVTQTMEGSPMAANLLHRLFMSGVLDLENGKEIVEACYRIEKQGGENPIPDNCGLSSGDLKPFFAYVSVSKVDLSTTTLQEAVKGYKESMKLNAAA